MSNDPDVPVAIARLVVTTFFEPSDYKQFLRGAWEDWPFDQMAVFIVT